jgi:nucleoid DNA-binding protein
MREALDTIFQAVAEALANGDDVTLKSFGTFSTWKRRQEIRGFDGRLHQVDGAQIVFKASAALRRRLRAAP